MFTSIDGLLARSENGKRVLQSLRHDIVLGIYAPGTKLTEIAVCEKYAISRTVARQIIYQLESEGLLAMQENGCKCVTEFSLKDLSDLYGLRNYYETSAVEKIIDERRNNLVVFADVIVLLDQAKHLSQEEILQADLCYHRSIIALSQDKFILRGYDAIAPLLYTVFQMGVEAYSQDFNQGFYQEHLNLTDAIMSKPKDECLNYIKDHHGIVEETAKNAYAILKKQHGGNK